MQPIVDKEGEIVCVCGADITLEWLSAELAKIDDAIMADEVLNQYRLQRDLDFYTVVIDDDGSCIVHPEGKNVPIKDKTVLKAMEQCKSGSFDMDVEGDRVDHHQAIATYCRPLRQADGRIVGVLTTDMSFSRLAKLINDASLDDDHGFFYILLGADGRFLIHPDASRQYRKTIFSDLDPRRNADIFTLGHEMATGKRGTLHVKYNGQHYHVCYKPVPGTDWSLALVCPEPL